MVQEVSNGDGLAVGGEIGKKFRERLVVPKFSVVDEQHDRHGGELLREGGQAEIRASIYLRFRTKIADAIGSRVNISSAISNQDSETGLVWLDDRAEYRLFRALHGLSSLAQKLRGAKQGKKQCCSCDPTNSVQHTHLESAAGAYHPAGRSSCWMIRATTSTGTCSGWSFGRPLLPDETDVLARTQDRTESLIGAGWPGRLE